MTHLTRFLRRLFGPLMSAWDQEFGPQPALAPAVPPDEPTEVIEQHTTRTVTTAEAAREWEAMTRPTTRVMVDLQLWLSLTGYVELAIRYGNHVRLLVLPTRGHVRRLCAALGIPLKEQPT